MSPSKKNRRKSPPPKLGQSSTPTWARAVVVVMIAALVIGLLSVLAFRDNGSSSDKSNVTAAGASSTTAATSGGLPSAAGKPCVAVTDPLPAGAPQVPVAVGPPPTKLVSQDLVPGTGAAVEATSTITVDYIGVACSTGKVFDASYGQQPATFPLNGVIPGWQQGLLGAKVGGTRLLGIPAEMAYGAQGYPPKIAPDEPLWFVVQVKNVQAGAG